MKRFILALVALVACVPDPIAISSSLSRAPHAPSIETQTRKSGAFQRLELGETPHAFGQPLAFLYHGLVTNKSASAPPPSFSNTHSFHNTGSATSTAGHINFGQPSAWYFAPNATEWTFNFWFRYDDRVGTLFGNRTSGVAQVHVGLSGGSLIGYFGSNNANTADLDLDDGAWHCITWTVRNESGTYVGRFFVDDSSTSRANTNAGSGNGTGIDYLMGHRRGSNNTDYAFGEYTNAWFNQLTAWDVGFTGAEHQELCNGMEPMDPTTHSQAANLVNWYPLGTGDTSPTCTDQQGSDDATIINTGTGVFETVVP